MQGGGIMVWAALLPDGTLFISRIEGRCSKEWYLNLLEKEVLPFLRSKFNKRFVFQQDNAPCHKAKVVKNYFMKEEIQVLEWPPYSPDISPIENVFHLLKNYIYDGHQFSRKEDLWQRIQQAVEIFNTRRRKQLKSLHESLHDRALDILINNGFKLKY